MEIPAPSCETQRVESGLGRLVSISPVIGPALQSGTCLKFQMRVQWMTLGLVQPLVVWRLRAT
jgi:hypothetical protein